MMTAVYFYFTRHSKCYEPVINPITKSYYFNSFIRKNVNKKRTVSAISLNAISIASIEVIITIKAEIIAKGDLKNILATLSRGRQTFRLDSIYGTG